MFPGNVSLEEGFCMVRQCRAQMPLYRPEPFYVGPDLGDAVGVNVDAMPSATNDLSYTQGLASGYNAVIPPLLRPLRRRPPAPIFVGRPLRPLRTYLFGRRGNDPEENLENLEISQPSQPLKPLQ